MRPLANPVVKEAAAAMQAALKSGDESAINMAFEQFTSSVSDTIKNDFEQAHGDREALAKRGYRMLTAQETEFYQNWIEAGKSSNPQQAVTDLLDGGMPETIIEDVYRNLVNEHPLLDAVTFTNVSYLTRWIMNDHTVQSAQWGEITEAIKKEITTSFKLLEMAHCKLSCFAVVPRDMLDLGPVFLDGYIRTILTDAIGTALENAIVNGTGKNMPIGLNRDIHKGVAVTDGEYPKKTAIKVLDFLPATYGDLVARLCKTENGKYRKIEGLSLICNPVDYYKKVMPATTVMSSIGTYTTNVFPVPTETFESAELAEGEAVLCILKEYFAALGSPKNGVIEIDDSVRFFEDQRAYKIKLFGNGRAYDDTVALLLDISELDPAYITVRNVSGGVASASEEIETV